eukprot:1162091-Pelagomonas_calceolata.AAC.2
MPVHGGFVSPTLGTHQLRIPKAAQRQHADLCKLITGKAITLIPSFWVLMGNVIMSTPLTSSNIWDLTTNVPLNLLTDFMPILLSMPTSLLPLGVLLKTYTLPTARQSKGALPRLCYQGYYTAIWQGDEHTSASAAERCAQAFLLNMHPDLTTNLLMGNGASTPGRNILLTLTCLFLSTTCVPSISKCEITKDSMYLAWTATLRGFQGVKWTFGRIIPLWVDVYLISWGVLHDVKKRSGYLIWAQFEKHAEHKATLFHATVFHGK